MTILNLAGWEVTNIGQKVSSQHTFSWRSNYYIIYSIRFALIPENTLLSSIYIHAYKSFRAIRSNIVGTEINLFIV